MASKEHQSGSFLKKVGDDYVLTDNLDEEADEEQANLIEEHHPTAVTSQIRTLYLSSDPDRFPTYAEWLVERDRVRRA